MEFYSQRRLENEAETKASAIDFLIDVWSGKLRDFALTYVYGIERSLNDRTIEIIKNALGDASHLEIDRLGRVRWFITEVSKRFKDRTTTIARTEVTRSANLGKDIGARDFIDQQGVGGYKLWLGRVADERPTHIAVNDTIIGIDDLFHVGGFYGDASW